MLFKSSYLIQIANSLLGIPYRHLGRDSKQGLDCYGLVIHFYKLLGFKLYDPIGNYPEDWWKANSYIDDYCNHDFRVTDKFFCGNILSIKTQDSNIANHLAIYLGVDFVLNIDQFIGVHRLRLFVLNTTLMNIFQHKEIEIINDYT